MYLFHHHFCPAAGRMSKIAQLWKDLSELVWAVKAKSAWDAWRETVANLPEDVTFEDRCLTFLQRDRGEKTGNITDLRKDSRFHTARK